MKRALLYYLITNQIAAAAGLVIIGTVLLVEWVRMKRAQRRIRLHPSNPPSRTDEDWQSCAARRDLGVAGLFLECTRRKGHELGDDPVPHSGSITDLEWA